MAEQMYITPSKNEQKNHLRDTRYISNNEELSDNIKKMMDLDIIRDLATSIMAKDPTIPYDVAYRIAKADHFGIDIEIPLPPIEIEEEEIELSNSNEGNNLETIQEPITVENKETIDNDLIIEETNDLTNLSNDLLEELPNIENLDINNDELLVNDTVNTNEVEEILTDEPIENKIDTNVEELVIEEPVVEENVQTNEIPTTEELIINENEIKNETPVFQIDDEEDLNNELFNDVTEVETTPLNNNEFAMIEPESIENSESEKTELLEEMPVIEELDNEITIEPTVENINEKLNTNNAQVETLEEVNEMPVESLEVNNDLIVEEPITEEIPETNPVLNTETIESLETEKDELLEEMPVIEELDNEITEEPINETTNTIDGESLIEDLNSINHEFDFTLPDENKVEQPLETTEIKPEEPIEELKTNVEMPINNLEQNTNKEQLVENLMDLNINNNLFELDNILSNNEELLIEEPITGKTR